MEFIYNFSENIDTLLDEAINKEQFTRWYWAVYQVDENHMLTIERHYSSFVRLFICNKSYEKFHDVLRERNITPYSIPEKVTIVSSLYCFHPKVYLFCNEDETIWKCFISSSNFNTSSMAQTSIVLTNNDDSDGNNELLFEIKKLFAISYPEIIRSYTSHWAILPNRSRYYSKQLFQEYLIQFNKRFGDSIFSLEKWRKSDLLEILFFPQWQKVSIYKKDGKIRNDVINKTNNTPHKRPIYFCPSLLERAITDSDTSFWECLSKISREKAIKKEDYLSLISHIKHKYLLNYVEGIPHVFFQMTFLLSIIAPSRYPFIYFEHTPHKQKSEGECNCLPKDNKDSRDKERQVMYSSLLHHLGDPSFKEDPFTSYWDNVVIPCNLMTESIDIIDHEIYNEYRAAMLQFITDNNLKKINFKQYVCESFMSDERLGRSTNEIIEDYKSCVINIFSNFSKERKCCYVLKDFLLGKTHVDLANDYSISKDSVKPTISKGKKDLERYLANSDNDNSQARLSFFKILNDDDFRRLIKFDKSFSEQFGEQYNLLTKMKEDIKNLCTLS